MSGQLHIHNELPRYKQLTKSLYSEMKLSIGGRTTCRLQTYSDFMKPACYDYIHYVDLFVLDSLGNI